MSFGSLTSPAITSKLLLGRRGHNFPDEAAPVLPRTILRGCRQLWAISSHHPVGPWAQEMISGQGTNSFHHVSPWHHSVPLLLTRITLYSGNVSPRFWLVTISRKAYKERSSAAAIDPKAVTDTSSPSSITHSRFPPLTHLPPPLDCQLVW